MTETPRNYFENLAAVDVSARVEKKSGYSYLSWPYAVAELLQRHPEATWRTVEDNGLPYWATPLGVFVKVGVTVNGIERIQTHPVLDGANRPIKEPNAFQVNTSTQRALVKAIALHGLGLYIYAGEDVPDLVAEERTAEQIAKEEADKAKAQEFYDIIKDATTQEELAAVAKEIAAAALSPKVAAGLRALWSERKGAVK